MQEFSIYLCIRKAHEEQSPQPLIGTVESAGSCPPTGWIGFYSRSEAWVPVIRSVPLFPRSTDAISLVRPPLRPLDRRDRFTLLWRSSIGRYQRQSNLHHQPIAVPIVSRNLTAVESHRPLRDG